MTDDEAQVVDPEHERMVALGHVCRGNVMDCWAYCPVDVAVAPRADQHPDWCKCQRVCGGDQ